MIKQTKLIAFVLLASMTTNVSKAQTALFEYIGFEELTSVIDTNEVWDGSNGNTLYQTSNNYVAQLDMLIGWDTSWGGYWKNQWAFSRKNYTNLEPSDFSKHLYAAKPGKGAEENGEVYAIGSQNTYLLNPLPASQIITGFSIANTTYAYNSMYYGDNFAKKFNAADKDSFILNIRFYYQQNLQGIQQVVLSDFRSENTSEHIILDSWQRVQFDYPLVDSIHFELTSSDVGQFGINTPTYFALDQIAVIHPNNTKKLSAKVLSLYPNPAQNRLYIAEIATISQLTFCDFRGSAFNIISPEKEHIDISELPAGMYIVHATYLDGSTASTRLVKYD